MKSNKGKINELALSDIIGDVGSAAFKKITGQAQGQTMQQKMAQDMFLRDFIGKVMGNLSAAIKSGLVDDSLISDLKAIDPGTVKPTQPAAQPAAQSTTQKQVQKPMANVPAGNKSIQNLNNYVRNVSAQLSKIPDKNQKINLTRQLVNAMADRKNTPEWNNALKTVELILKKNADPNFATTAIQSLRQGKKIDMPAKVAESWQIYYINMLVENAGLSWDDLGLSVVKKKNKFSIVETKYLKLNNVFEQIVNEAESISQYLQKWFKQYMHGVNYSSYKSDIDKMINDVQNTYKKDKGKSALTKLANTAWVLSQVGAQDQDEEPTMAPAATRSTPQAQPTSTTTATATQNLQNATEILNKMSSKELAQLVKLSMDKIQKSDPSTYSTILKNITTPVAKPAFKVRPAATQPAKTPTPVTAESKKQLRKK